MTGTHVTASTAFVEANGISFAYRRFGEETGVPLLLMQHFRTSTSWGSRSAATSPRRLPPAIRIWCGAWCWWARDRGTLDAFLYLFFSPSPRGEAAGRTFWERRHRRHRQVGDERTPAFRGPPHGARLLERLAPQAMGNGSSSISEADCPAPPRIAS
jgi:hypothetical protein